MGRYKKYLEIIDECDRCIEQQGMRLLDGKVTMDNLAKIEKVLCIMEKAWCVAWQIDRLDDINRAMTQIAHQRQSGGEKMPTKAEGGALAEGNDFRNRGEYSAIEGAAWGQPEPNPGQEEDRRGRPRRHYTRSEAAMSEAEARRHRRYRALMDALDTMELAEENYATGNNARDFLMVPGLGFPSIYNNRMGYEQNPHQPEQNTPYNAGPRTSYNQSGPTGDRTISTHSPEQSGVVHVPLQSTGATSANGAATNTANNQGVNR